MVFIHGYNLLERRIVWHALQRFYGVGPQVAARLCARFQIHDRMTVGQLSPQHILAIQTFLTSPINASLPGFPRAPPDFVPPDKAPAQHAAQPAAGEVDTLRGIRLEGELRQQMRDNIMHHKIIGSYVGRRHAMALPVRGQNTQTNAMTARKLNKIERRN